MAIKGVNFIADIRGDGSLSEVARTLLRVLEYQQIPISYVEALYPYQMYRTAETNNPHYTHLPRQGHRYPVNLLFYNLHIFDSVTDKRLYAMTGGHYTVGHWVWEMPQIPASWIAHFARIDEVWCPSSYTQGIFRAVTDRLVTIMPYPIMGVNSGASTRTDFGLPEHRYIFFFSFSAGSGDGRKNPWGLIEAYKRAFGTSRAADAPLLVIKTQHSHDYPELVAALQAGLDEIGGMLMTQALERQQLDDLVSLIDVYASLHRAEGFGLGMAEAMNVGKPVIATRYSGNMDYMNDEVAYLVDYTLRGVRPEDHRYRPDLIELYREGLDWAEADLDQAAAHMRHLYENPDEGRERGQKAAQFIHDYCGLEAMSRRVLESLEAAQNRA